MQKWCTLAILGTKGQFWGQPLREAPFHGALGRFLPPNKELESVKALGATEKLGGGQLSRVRIYFQKPLGDPRQGE